MCKINSEVNKMNIEQYALTKYPEGKIDGITYEDGFGKIVWITTRDKSTHVVSTKQMSFELEGLKDIQKK
jgi:hypothetical protein